ncbi:DNA-directed DNA polymerase [Candidatus Hecatella orcuttiae]|uniref:DNA-directed DNA polymerase n=1 Tax=Candidatus Hecatella orcuttiae TaxID=1935119 RepID=UPI002867E4E0|nr:DNA polymerase domain-containing protein [Candidatus Hecatella orcuttiae]
MKVSFWLLDVNHETVDGGSEVRMWGVDEAGNRVLVADRGFNPSFYLLPHREEDAEKVAEAARKNIKASDLVAVEVERKKYFGRELKAVRVEVVGQEALEKYPKVLAKNPLVKDVLHDDFRVSSQYLLHGDLKPCGWLSVDGEKITPPPGVKVKAAYSAKSQPRMLERLDIPKLRVLAFSAVYHSEIGSPNPERDPVLVLSTLTGEGAVKTFQVEEFDDGALLKSFVQHVQAYDPDVLVGYGSNRLDFPYLLHRCGKHGVKLALDRTGGEPHTSLYGHVSVVGRANVDLQDFAQDIPEVKVKTLANVARFLGVEGSEKAPHLPETEISKLWKDREKRRGLVEACVQNTRLVMGLSEAMLPFAFQLSNLIGLPADHVGSAAVGFRVDWYLARKALTLGELIPKRVEQPYYPYKGGAVLEPEPGLHRDIAVFDFSAMYPNLMIKYNLSPDTYLDPEEPEPPGGAYVTPEVGHRFRREPPGFYKQVLEELMKARADIRGKMEGLNPRSFNYKLLDARQKSVKVVTNAVYGYCGWRGARWFLSQVAEATAALGRKTIQDTIAAARKHGLEVVYGDTDSVFVKYEEAKVKKFLEWVNREIGLEIRPSVIYRRVLFTEAKKRYAGLLSDGRVDIVGLEVARGDWCEASKQVQEKVVEILLKEELPEKAVEYVRSRIFDFKRGVFNVEDLIIWKTITKPLEEYQVRAPHVEAAKKLREKGWKLTYGDKVGYLIVRGEGKLYQRAVPYFLAEPDRLDVDYYVDNQIVPATLRVLQIFNITEDQLKGGEAGAVKKKGQVTLFPEG